ncbi:thiosulfate oxidation carrier complex protein SoxZ [Ferrovibrio sp.]|uniref:thiosulfate oxidation carrier complex protein SoxZ n=1 Tax=Ferrovibrio sp. TaxID=1917215 RepID=UPI000CC21BF0|nr:thiosulfate oxidation carrier complex protein SoxZ [Ferrovibrio sp.]PJI38011.1 MAG: thiosulfate oxidation carrier complex protein SoxZ [Ferrovibrio sp.]
MSTDIRPRIRIPQGIQRGDVIEIKTMISHPMESGQRKDDGGRIIPRMIVNRMTVTLNGRQVFEARLEPAVSANPYVSFFLKCTQSGRLDFTWTDDNGGLYKASRDLTVA